MDLRGEKDHNGGGKGLHRVPGAMVGRKTVSFICLEWMWMWQWWWHCCRRNEILTCTGQLTGKAHQGKDIDSVMKKGCIILAQDSAKPYTSHV